MVMTGCQENKSCSKVLNFLERLDDRIRCTPKPLADSNEEEGFRGRGLERQKLMIVRVNCRHSDGRHSDCRGGDEQYVEQ